MADREPASDRLDSLKAQREGALRQLHKWQQRAQEGYKLKGHRRLLAALALTSAWRQANKSGLRREEFQERVLAGLHRPHARRETFKLANYTLPRQIGEITPDVITSYVKKREPMRALEPYLIAIGVAAEHCGVEPDEWKLGLISSLDLQPISEVTVDLLERDEDLPFLNLTILLQSLCKSIARRCDLGRALASLSVPGAPIFARWDMFDERLHHYPGSCMLEPYSPISPVLEPGVYAGEMLALPSVPLIRVPYLVGAAKFALAPDLEADLERAVDSAARFDRDGTLIYMREIRLAVVPDGRGGFAGALESRPRVEVDLSGNDEIGGRHLIERALSPDLDGNFYDCRQPIIRPLPEASFRIDCLLDSWGKDYCEDHGFRAQSAVSDNQGCGWMWQPDPVRDPDGGGNEPWYVTYTTVAPDYLRYWLTTDWTLGSVSQSCPWERAYHPRDDPNVPPPGELNFAVPSHAGSIEIALHNGDLERSLEQAARRVVDEIAKLQREQADLREHHVQALLERFQENGRRESKP